MNTNACANTVAELAEGRKVEDAWDTHCAELAVGGFYLALTNWQELQRQALEEALPGKVR